MCPECHDKRRSSCVRCRFESYRTSVKHLSQLECELLERYRNIPIRDGIEAATGRSGLGCLDVFESLKEAFSFELVQKWQNEIVTEKPPLAQIFRRSRHFTLRRKGTWLLLLIKQYEAIKAASAPLSLLQDQEGNISHFWVHKSNDIPFLPPSPFTASPEDFLLQREAHLKIKTLPERIRSSDMKHACSYERILTLQLEGIDVSGEHATHLHVSREDVRHLKHQMIEEARRIVSEDDPELAEKQARYKAHRGKRWKVEKSTFEQRTASYKDASGAQEKPRLIRHWKVIAGKQGPKTFGPSGSLPCPTYQENTTREEKRNAQAKPI